MMPRQQESGATQRKAIYMSDSAELLQDRLREKSVAAD